MHLNLIQIMAVSKDDSTAATFESLPFDVHVMIIRKLNLADALSYAELSSICHDAVYYVFSHRLQIDFSSTLNKDRVINLSDDTVLKVLRAHTRANEIRHLSLSPNFKAIDELKFYMDLYWHYSFIPEYNDDLSPSTFSGEWVGHPAGHLTLIGYCHLQPAVSAVLNSYDDPVYGVSIESEPRDRLMPILNDQKNWSTTNLDQPYIL